uniref:Uncharacterized protein n=1 Tax=Parascaris univalens TaxID=6257 RepID=A0A915AMK3_PARUN
MALELKLQSGQTCHPLQTYAGAMSAIVYEKAIEFAKIVSNCKIAGIM